MPKISEIEYTSNPNIIKILLKEFINQGSTKVFIDKEASEYNSLAKDLFATNHIKSVFIKDKVITITKNEDIEWTDLLPKIAQPIRQYQYIPSLKQTIKANTYLENLDNNDFVKKIYEVISLKIKPMLANDGGGVDIVDIQGKKVMIRYQGACSCCPSGLTSTLAFIEDTLRKDLLDSEINVIHI